ncbi:MAG: hypothetical protein VYB61_05010 [Verrucomicrobiota bacterium]|nr:hypothetical protein [Verrucomicrobiota bacterium]
MDTPETAKASGDAAGLSPDRAFKLGSWLITGVAGGLLFGRVLRETLKIGICSVLPLVVYQVLRKPAGSRRVIAGKDSSQASLHDRAVQSQDMALAQAPVAPEDFKADAQGREQSGSPVFIGQRSAEDLSPEQETEKRFPAEEELPVTEHRYDLSGKKEASLSSNAEWAAGLLDAIETREENVESLKLPQSQEAGQGLTLADTRFNEPLSDEGFMDSPVAPPGEGLDPGFPATPLQDCGEPGTDEKTVQDTAVVPLPEGEDRAVSFTAGPGVGGQVDFSAHPVVLPSSRKPDPVKQHAYRRVPLDISQLSMAVAAPGASTGSFPAEEFHDAFSSAPYPGPSVPGVKAVENPFTRNREAATPGGKPGDLASVILQGNRRSARKVAGGNAILGRMLLILLIGGLLSYGIFLSSQALRGTKEEMPNPSYSIVPETRNALESHANAPARGPVSGKEDNVSAGPLPEPLNDDDHLPSFRSLE